MRTEYAGLLGKRHVEVRVGLASAPGATNRTGAAPRGGFDPRSPGKSARMEIGIVGILVVILLVVLIIYFIRRA
jgi:hypothetical protein